MHKCKNATYLLIKSIPYCILPWLIVDYYSNLFMTISLIHPLHFHCPNLWHWLKFLDVIIMEINCSDTGHNLRPLLHVSMGSYNHHWSNNRQQQHYLFHLYRDLCHWCLPIRTFLEKPAPNSWKWSGGMWKRKLVQIIVKRYTVAVQILL